MRKTKMKQRSAGKADLDMGKLIRIRRMEKKISQAELGDQLGVSFQQIQKYEKGMNRVSAVRLEQIANMLEVPVTYFLDQSETVGKLVPEMAAFMTSPEGMKIAKAFMSLRDAKARHAVRFVIETIAASHAVTAEQPKRLRAA